MYRTLILNYAAYAAILVVIVALAVKLAKLSSLEHSDKPGLFLGSFRFYSKPVLRNMVSKQGQEYLRFTNKVNMASYCTLLGILLLYLAMKAI
ncbi:MAG: hypothetical protein EOP51_01990 [Sphingobacteriales bacterium]|nr:MAG: hypothetical protein EOP51_01990 [Sphingobacteriales bacterium]